jgi:ABC-type branched-subunit amino acid transport system substrate-binding protein
MNVGDVRESCGENRLGPAILAVSALAVGCSEPPTTEEDPIEIGVILSYTGYLAASSVNSERALAMTIEAANRAGGIAGRRLHIVARDTRSDASKVGDSVQRLLDAKPAVIIGPDTTELITQLQPLLKDRTLLLPSLNTSGDVRWKSSSWFVMGPSLGRVGCELVSQMTADGRSEPLILVSPAGYNSELAWDMTNHHGMRKVALPSDVTADSVRQLAEVLSDSADSFVLAAFPSVASKLIYGLASVGALPDPKRWYLSPVLHTPAFLEGIPRGLLDGARGVSPGTVVGAGDFRAAFFARWQDRPMDDAFPFYDAGVVAILAIQRALIQEGAIPSATGLSKHIIAVTKPGGAPVRWNEIGHALELLRNGVEIDYFGLSGQLQFDSEGKTPSASTSWWNIVEGAFEDVPHNDACTDGN